MTSGYEKRRAADEAVRYEAGYERGLNGKFLPDRRGHTKPFLDGIEAGRKELATKRRGERANQRHRDAVADRERMKRSRALEAKVREENARRRANEAFQVREDSASRRVNKDDSYMKILDDALTRARNEN